MNLPIRFLSILVSCVAILTINSCTETEVIPIDIGGEPPVVVTCESGQYEITDAAFGEYLVYLNVPGAVAQGTQYFIDTCLSKEVNTLELLKTSSVRAELAAAGLVTADDRIINLDGIQYFTGLDTLKLTSNQLTSLDLSSNTDLIVLEMNFNYVPSLDLSKNTKLQRLRFRASAQVPNSQKIVSIDLSNNIALKHVYLIRHRLTALDVSNNPNLDELIDLTDNPGPDNDDSTGDIPINATIYDQVQAAGGTLLGVIRE